MTTPATLQTARDLVQQAETAYQNGDDIACARLLWEATIDGFRQLAARMGCPCNNQEEAIQFSRMLDEKGHFGAMLNFGIYMLEYSQGADWTEDPEFGWEFDEFPLAISATQNALILLQAKMSEA